MVATSKKQKTEKGKEMKKGEKKIQVLGRVKWRRFTKNIEQQMFEDVSEPGIDLIGWWVGWLGGWSVGG